MAINMGVKRLGDGRYISELVDVCRNCKGLGLVEFDENGKYDSCPVCKGSGRVVVTKEIQVTVKPYKTH